MTLLITKYAVTAFIIVLVSEVAKRSDRLGALVSSLPFVTIMVLIWLNIANVRATDVNIPARYGQEVSTIRLHTAVPRISWLMFRGFWRRMWLKYMLWSFSPIAVMLIAGIFAVLVGLGFGLWATAQALGGTSPTAGTAILAVVPFMSGFFLLLQALVLDIQQTPD